jgi:very-short-patch-repair endonuclease
MSIVAPHLLTDRHPVLAVADRQRGLVKSEEVSASGISRKEIRHLCRIGVARRYHRGLYLFGPVQAGPEQRWLAATLVTDGWLADRSAAACWSMADDDPLAVHVLVDGDRRSRKGIVTHRMSFIHDHDVTRHRGVPVTTVPRTLVDNAKHCSGPELLGMVRGLRTLDLDALQDAIERTPRRPRIEPLRRLVDLRGPQLRSRLEAMFLELCRAGNVDPPRVNTVLHGFEVDFRWDDARLVVETDGWSTHGNRSSFVRDRQKDNVLLARGWPVARFTFDEVALDPGGIARRLHELLAARRAALRDAAA